MKSFFKEKDVLNDRIKINIIIKIVKTKEI